MLWQKCQLIYILLLYKLSVPTKSCIFQCAAPGLHTFLIARVPTTLPFKIYVQSYMLSFIGNETSKKTAPSAVFLLLIFSPVINFAIGNSGKYSFLHSGVNCFIKILYNILYLLSFCHPVNRT